MTNDRNEIKTWTLEIPFANTSARKNAKAIGATWNSDTKAWTVVCSEYKLDCKNLWKFVRQTEIKSEVKNQNTKLDLGVGFSVANNEKAIRNAYKFGFDAIEN